jgi:hypothetical protein
MVTVKERPMSASNFEQAAHARLERELALVRAQVAKRLREQNAALMSSEQWARIYGAPVPGQSRPLADVAAERQLAAARGRVFRPLVGDGPEVAFGDESKVWR